MVHVDIMDDRHSRVNYIHRQAYGLYRHTILYQINRTLDTCGNIVSNLKLILTLGAAFTIS